MSERESNHTFPRSSLDFISFFIQYAERGSAVV